MEQRLLVYSDGGARGNPGPTAIAFIVLNEKNKIIKTAARFIGTHTNNQAEYKALLMALEFTLSQKPQEIVCHLDSELVVKQLNGEYAVRNYELKQLWLNVKELKKRLAKICFINVPRSNPQIQIVDKLVNRTLDAQTKKHWG
jgi:ribonuclease HI